MPADLYPAATPPTIKIPQLLDTASNGSGSGSNDTSKVTSPVSQEGGNGNGNAEMQQGNEEYNGALHGFVEFHSNAAQSTGFGIPGQVPAFSAAGGEMNHNSMFQVYEEPPTAKPRQRALSQLTIPTDPSSSSSGPLSAPVHPSDSTSPNSSTSSSSRLFLPDGFSSPTSQSSNSTAYLQVPQPQHRAVPQGLPESPEPPAAGEWDDYGLPSWAMGAFCDSPPDNNSTAMQNTQQHPNGFGEIDIAMDMENMGISPWMTFGSSLDAMNCSMGAMGSFGSGMNGMGGGMNGMNGGGMDGMDGISTNGNGPNGEYVGDHYSMQIQYEDLLDPSQIL
ncbi:uncharacterized protein FOMMEDRAFT_31250 [Fomitiporia mediterranea MF3/22]|uniref:uncharacterized protein n=1 Tax=Fomitiporia mediterranea (strain MF3/22) TaxID=694068 RepID=UPI0004408E1F|nr:uncharacterized protein FOMMEDRAFT_31250 [Fomitiporia mediterranea MF3/22]EJC99136.1 hypothetical protein FOMMEDRAFT_31250 [Fomitiporia mediterranea MF3/22]